MKKDDLKNLIYIAIYFAMAFCIVYFCQTKL